MSRHYLHRDLLLALLLMATATARCQSLIGSTRPVTMPGVLGVSADGASYAPTFSQDGRWVAFTSQANNLVTNDDTASFLDVFLRDLNSGTTSLVSANLGGVSGGNGNSGPALISSNGQFVAFLSCATNISSPAGSSYPNIYLRDTLAQTTGLISVSPANTAGVGGYCVGFDMSPDGRYIAFSSTQTNLVSASVSLVTNIYLRDCQLGTTELISRQVGLSSGAHGNSDFPLVSADGRWVLFYSEALDLVTWPGTIPPAGQIFLKDRQTGVATCIGTNAAPFIATPTRSFSSVLSQSGSAAVFIAQNTSNLKTALIYYNLTNGTTSLISTGVLASTLPDISANGQWISYAVNSNVYVWDAQIGSNSIVSISLDGKTNGYSYSPSISADGSKVVFISDATNLTSTPGNGLQQLFIRDLAFGTTRLVSRNIFSNSSGDQGLSHGIPSSDGLFVAFASGDPTLVANDFNGASDVFRWSWNSGSNELVSVRQSLKPSSCDRGLPISGSLSVSSNGQLVIFAALDGTLVPNDTNDYADVFVHDMTTGLTRLISTDLNGGLSTNGPAGSPAISPDGKYAAFVRGAATGTNWPLGDIYLCDLTTATLRLISTNSSGVPTGNASPPVFSPDSTRIAYSTTNSLSTNDVNQNADVYLYDISNGTNMLISAAPSGNTTPYDSMNPVFSPDGRWLVFQSRSPTLAGTSLGTTGWQLYARDLPSNVIKHVSYAPSGNAFAGDNSNALFSANSRYLAFKSSDPAYTAPVCMHDFTALTNRIVCSNCSSPSLSGDGNLIAYTKTNGAMQVYVSNVQTGGSNIVSLATNGVAADGASGSPVLTSDGRFAVFVSKADNLIPGDTNQSADVFVRDLTAGSVIALSSGRGVIVPGDGSSVVPVLAADGRTIVFESFSSNLTPNNFSGSRDLFMARLGIGDSDGDGMDDDWELTHFGDLSHDGTADTDGDGSTDYQEYLAGTDPTNNSSSVRCTTVLFSSGGALVFWQAIPGRCYRVEFKNDLSDSSWSILIDSYPASKQIGSIVDPTPNGWRRFYRVAALP